MLQVTGLKPWIAAVSTLALMMPTVAEAETAPTPAAAKLLPDDTAYAMLLDMRSETWQQLDQFAFFQQLQAQGNAPLDPGGLPFLPDELDYQTDIAPWVGETVVLALLPLDRPQVTVLAEHEVMIAPIAQPDQFTGFINTVTDLRGVEPKTQPYQTLDILYWEPQFLEVDANETGSPPLPEESEPADLQPEVMPLQSKALPDEADETTLPDEPEPDVPGLAIAVLPDFIIAAEHPAAIRAWAEQRPAQPEDALATNPRFLRTLAHPHYDASLGAFYGSLSEILKYSLADFSLPDLPFNLPLPETLSPQDLAQLASLQLDSSLEVLIYPGDWGIRLQGRGYYDDTLLQTLPATIQPAPSETLNYVPKDSYGLLSGQNLAAIWREATTAIAANEAISPFLQQARSVFTGFTGLDLDRDLFGWMDQGFSVFLFPTENTPLSTLSPDLQIGLGVVLQTSDRAKAESTFAALDERLDTDFITVEPSSLNGNPVTSWGFYLDDDAQPDSFFGRGWASEDTLVLTTSLGSLEEILTLEPVRALPNSLQFLRAIEDFPAQNQGHLHANVSSILQLFYRFFPIERDNPVSENSRQLMGTVQSLSGTFSFSEEYVQIDGLLMLVPADPRTISSAASQVAPLE